MWHAFLIYLEVVFVVVCVGGASVLIALATAPNQEED